MYGINSKNGGSLRGVWLTQADAERVACQQSRNDAKAGTWYVTDKNQQRVAAFQNGSDVSEREGIVRATQEGEVFRVVTQSGAVREARVTWHGGETAQATAAHRRRGQQHQDEGRDTVSDDLHRAIPYTPFFGALYDVLVENGANVPGYYTRDQHAACEALNLARGEGPSPELRIIGAIRGGKLRYKSTERKFYVDGYIEDETPEMLAIEERINAALAEFCATWTGPSPWRAP